MARKKIHCVVFLRKIIISDMAMENRRRWHPVCLRSPTLWVGLIVISLSAALLWDQAGNRTENFRSDQKAADPIIDFAAAQKPWDASNADGPTDDMHQDKKDGEASRRVYPYSVVQGGVHSVQELRSAIGRDPVVARHYSNFKLDSARIAKAAADGDFHVSYRMGEEIFWTKKRLRVARNETLITDGTTFTRTRCANVLSDVLPGKTSPDEPAPEVFDTPALPPSHVRPFTPVVSGGPSASMGPSSDPAPFASPGVVGGGPPGTMLPPSGFIPPVVITGGAPGPGGNPLDPSSGPGSGGGPGTDTVPVPEPATLFFFAFGLLGLVGYGAKKFLNK